MSPDDERVTEALGHALEKQWPFIVHIEFAAAGSRRDEFMAKLEALLSQHPNHPFLMIHMGQLGSVAARRLIEVHMNISFMTAHSNTVVVRRFSQPWVNLFDGDRLSAEWKKLPIDHPDRFVLAFDNVFAEHWGPHYLSQMALWRNAAKELPEEVAHVLFHGNAERLWRLPPVD